MDNSVTATFVANNRLFFEKVMNQTESIKSIDDVIYDVLDYDKILDEMCDFIGGFLNYRKEKGDDHQFKDKIAFSTKTFCERMFIDRKYRKDIGISEFKYMNESFLKKTKMFQELIDECNKLKETSFDSELSQLITIMNNQYRRVAKVFSDDMKIYLWLTTGNCKFENLRYKIPTSVLVSFQDKSTPVMHKKG